MGQVIGKAAIDPSAVPFVGLPRRAIVDLFDAYHSIAEGYGITTAEVTEIVQLSLGDYLALGLVPCCFDTSTKSRRVALLAKDFFVLLDSDQNALIDTFEFLSTLVLLSACTATEKIKHQRLFCWEMFLYLVMMFFFITSLLGSYFNLLQRMRL